MTPYCISSFQKSAFHEYGVTIHSGKNRVLSYDCIPIFSLEGGMVVGEQALFYILYVEYFVCVGFELLEHEQTWSNS